MTQQPRAIDEDARVDHTTTSPLLVGVASLAIGLMIALRLLIPNGMDATVFLALGEDAPVQARYASERVGGVVTRDALGHDGKFFFIQANDPWFLDPERNAALLDRPVYRGGRMLYPMIAGGFGVFPPGWIVWSMLVTNLLAVGIGAALVASLAARWNASPWLGLAVPLNIGLIFEIGIDGAGVVAYVFCLGAVYSLVEGRSWLAALLLAAAALSREAMLAFAIGLILLSWVEERRIRWRLFAVPVAVLALWYAYLRWRLVGISGTGGGSEIFAAPFVGMLRSFPSWVQDPSDLILNGSLLFVAVVFTMKALRSRFPLVWGAIPFVLLSTVLSRYVWNEPFDLSRALTPVITAFPFVLLAQMDPRSPELTEPPMREPV